MGATVWTARNVKSALRSRKAMFDEQRNEILITEVGITSQEQLQTMEAEKAQKYDLLAGG